MADANEKTAPNKAPEISFGPYSSGRRNNIEVAVWLNEIVTSDDRTVNTFSVSFARNYRDEEGWKKSKSLRLQDIPILVHALNKAQDWILEHQNSKD